jgi:hypothetical protein
VTEDIQYTTIGIIPSKEVQEDELNLEEDKAVY